MPQHHPDTPSPRRRAPRDPATLDVRTLFQQLVRATAALDAALDSFGTDPASLREAREALEAFDLLERTSVDFTVPRSVRKRVREADHHLSTGHLELARADVARAGSEFERHLLGRGHG